MVVVICPNPFWPNILDPDNSIGAPPPGYKPIFCSRKNWKNHENLRHFFCQILMYQTLFFVNITIFGVQKDSELINGRLVINVSCFSFCSLLKLEMSDCHKENWPTLISTSKFWLGFKEALIRKKWKHFGILLKWGNFPLLPTLLAGFKEKIGNSLVFNKVGINYLPLACFVNFCLSWYFLGFGQFKY